MAAKNLTEGRIPTLLVWLALPVVASFGLQTLYQLADLFFVGRLGGEALAGLAISLNVFFLVLALGMSVGVGALALISQAYGRGDRAQVPALFQQTFWLLLALGAGGWAAAWLAADAYIGTFTRDPGVLAAGTAYFRIYSGTFLTQIFVMVCGFCWRAVGDFWTPMALMSLGSVANVLLDPLLIFGLGPVPALGIAGAAIATVASQALGVAAYLWIVFGTSGNTLLVVRRPLRLQPRAMGRILRIGLPAGLQFVLFAAAMMVIYRVVRPFGGDASAAVGVVFRLMQSAVLPVVALSSAVASTVGQNYGAQRPDRVRAAWVWGAGYAFVVTLLEYVALGGMPGFWLGLFAGEARIVAIGTGFLLIYGATLPLYSLSMITTAMAQGLGFTLYPLLGQAVRFATLLAALALLAPGGSGAALTGVFWSAALGNVAGFVCMAAVLLVLWHTVLASPTEQAGSDPAARAGLFSGGGRRAARRVGAIGSEEPAPEETKGRPDSAPGEPKRQQDAPPRSPS